MLAAPQARYVRPVRCHGFVGALLLVGCGWIPVAEETTMAPRSGEERMAPGAPDDAGTDAGLPELGRPPEGVRPIIAGTCGRAPASELARSPRPDRWLEFMALEARPQLIVLDDATYERASRELTALAADAGPARFGRLGPSPDIDEGLQLRFDDEGLRLVNEGKYTAWDCLNRAYRARTGLPTRWGTVSVSFEPVLWTVPTLVADYGALPHVTQVEPNPRGQCAACGCDNDGCLDLDDRTGTWTWILQRENSSCTDTWFRYRTRPDGSSTREVAAELPETWLAESPSCREPLRR